MVNDNAWRENTQDFLKVADQLIDDLYSLFFFKCVVRLQIIQYQYILLFLFHIILVFLKKRNNFLLVGF